MFFDIFEDRRFLKNFDPQFKKSQKASRDVEISADQKNIKNR